LHAPSPATNKPQSHGSWVVVVSGGFQLPLFLHILIFIDLGFNELASWKEVYRGRGQNCRGWAKDFYKRNQSDWKVTPKERETVSKQCGAEC